MSEYQCYEFVALERPLTANEMAELRAISTRAEISPTRFWNEYQGGNLIDVPEVASTFTQECRQCERLALWHTRDGLRLRHQHLPALYKSAVNTAWTAPLCSM